jgi:hypothetical protein
LPWEHRGHWPCQWIHCELAGQPPHVSAYRLRFSADGQSTVRVHVTADERYELFLDGIRIGRGSERGDAGSWYFETYDLELAEGAHVLVARVSALGEQAAFAQMTVRSGFLCCPQEPAWQTKIGTGKAQWEAKKLGGYRFDSPLVAWGTGAKLSIFGDQFDWGFESGNGDGWSPAEVLGPGVIQAANDQGPSQFLTPATLLPQLEGPWTKGVVRHVSAPSNSGTAGVAIVSTDDLPEEHPGWKHLIAADSPVTLAPHSRRRIIVDLEDYVCAYPRITISGGQGGCVRIHWEEALYSTPATGEKGNRDEIEGKFFTTAWSIKEGVGDCFFPDGQPRRQFETLWWECGRYVEIFVETADEPLTIESLQFFETRYPLEPQSQFETNDARFAEVTPIMVRVLQMCSHETYMDCPFYEQLQYIGDTRLQALVTYVLTRDDRLPRKALQMFDASRMHSGLTQSRYPSRVRQIIPPFSLCWVAMVHDYAMWKDDLDFVRGLIPGIRTVLDAYRASIGPDCLLGAVEGWNFLDWVPSWNGGIPPDGGDGISAGLNYQASLAFVLAGDLETAIGEPEMALRHRKTAQQLSQAANQRFWDESRGLFADDVSHTHWSEHTQCLAILVGGLSHRQRELISHNLIADPHLERATIYFSHYLFEAMHALNRPDRILERLEMWFGLKAMGFKTTLEHPEPSRSDCHAWGAHPLFHYFASFLGIRPTSPGFKRLEIKPQLGPLEWIRGSLPHPQGLVTFELHQEQAGVVGSVTLPEGVTGIFEHAGRTVKLIGGQQNI